MAKYQIEQVNVCKYQIEQINDVQYQIEQNEVAYDLLKDSLGVTIKDSLSVDIYTTI